MITTEKFNELLKVDLDNLKIQIKPVARGHLASEYNDFITDYSAAPVSLTNRKIDPHITSQTHGRNVFSGVLKVISLLKRNNSILDLGCGAGELLLSLKDKPRDLYGVTIHVGEVKFARKFGLPNVIPADMRDIDKYFNANSLDIIVAHHCFQFIPMEDRHELCKKILKILRPGGCFIFVDYKGEQSSSLPPESFNLFRKMPTPPNTIACGNLYVLHKSINKLKIDTSKYKTFDEYFLAVKTDARTQWRKATKNGYTISKIIDVQKYAADLYEIWTSKDVRQNRPINLNYESINRKRIEITKDAWPVEVYNTPDLEMYGCFKDGKLVAYLEIQNNNANESVVHSTLGHGDHMKFGVMKFLFLEVIKIKWPNVLIYGMTGQESFFKEDLLIL